MWKWMCFIAAALGISCWANQPVHAASNTYNVSAVLPSNQLDPQAHYFNLLVTPGSQQTLAIDIQNDDSGSHKFVVTPTRATTSANGAIDYGQRGAYAPASLPADIEKLLPKPKTYTVAPFSTRRVHLKLTAPTKAWPGILLGAIAVTRKDDASTSALSNHISVRIGVQLQAAKTLPQLAAQYQYDGVSAKNSTTATQLTAKFTNPIPTIQSAISVKAQLYRHDAKQPVATLTRNDLRMAPSSRMPLKLVTKKPLAPGKYRVAFTLTQNGRTWPFSDHFTVKKQATLQPTKTAAKQTARTALPAWLFIVLLVIVLGLGGIIFYLVKHPRKP